MEDYQAMHGLTSAWHTVPLPDCFSHLFSDVDAVAMKPFIAVVTTTSNAQRKCELHVISYTYCSVYGQCKSKCLFCNTTHIMKQLISGFRQTQYKGAFSPSILLNPG